MTSHTVQMTMNWQPIETAPKDRKILLYYHRAKIFAVGNWYKDEYAKKPKPHWQSDRSYMGKRWDRENSPSRWAELTPPTDLFSLFV